MRDFENQEQQDGDEDEADQAPLGLLSRTFWSIYIGQFGKGLPGCGIQDGASEGQIGQIPHVCLLSLLLYISSFTESDYIYIIYILNFVATIIYNLIRLTSYFLGLKLPTKGCRVFFCGWNLAKPSIWMNKKKKGLVFVKPT